MCLYCEKLKIVCKHTDKERAIINSIEVFA